ncbi:MAG: helix-turn-helix transcriptional regulator [Candidatus Methanomethylicaceae archaeon]
MEFGKYGGKRRGPRRIGKSFRLQNNSYIARVEREDFLPSKENLKKIAEVLKIPFKELDCLLFEVKLKEFGIKKPELLALFKNIPYLSEKEKKAIINAYLKVKEKMKRRK